MANKNDSIRKRISELRSRAYRFSDIVSKIEAEFGGECWFTTANGIVTVWREENDNSPRETLWTESA